nr:AAA family ATPase [Paenibacillus senegalensis]
MIIHNEPPVEHRQDLPVDPDPYQEMIRELNSMVGLENVKELVFRIYAMLKVNQMREKAGLKPSKQVHHMIFYGNPGTGKTTVARALAKLFHKMGLLSKGHLIEADRADLVGEYIGHTAQKTRELVKKALGGVLFVDEAYALARGGEKDFGKESIDTFVKMMEDHRDEFVLILAGYPSEMQQFIAINPGLPSRFPIQLEFPDYSLDELMQIAKGMTEERQYAMSESAELKVKSILQKEKDNRFLNFSNARYVRNVIEGSIRNHAARLLRQSLSPSLQDLQMLRAEDIHRPDSPQPAAPFLLPLE